MLPECGCKKCRGTIHGRNGSCRKEHGHLSTAAPLVSVDLIGTAPCGCRIERTGASIGIVQCPVHASAPDLLAALEFFLGSHDKPTLLGSEDCDCPCCYSARSAIRKARGEV